MVGIVISIVRRKPDHGLVKHIAAYNNNIYFPEMSTEDIATICAAPRVGGYGVDVTTSIFKLSNVKKYMSDIS